MFADASANMVLRKLRRLHGQKLDQRFGEVFGTNTMAEERDDQREATAIENTGRQQRRGGGGGWRAFIASYKDEHPEGSPDFKELARLYGAMDHEEKAHFQRLGAQGTRNHREGDAHPFGPTKVVQRREEKARMLRNAAAGLLEEGDLDPESTDALAQGHAEALMIGDQPDRCDSPWSAVLSVKAACAIKGSVKASAQKQRDRDMVGLESSGGKQVQEALSKALPSLASRSEDFLSSSSSPHQDSEGQVQHNHLVWQPVQGMKQACQLASFPANSKLGKQLFPRVQAAWQHLHAKVPSTPVAEVKGQDKHSARGACQHARTCVCSRSGRSHLATMVLNLKKAFRLVASSSQHGRADLLAARAVVAIVGRIEQQCVEANAQRAPLQEQMESNIDQALFLHLGHLSLKPWAPSWQLLRGGEPFPRLGLLFERPLALVGTCECRSTCEALADLDKSLRWDVAFYRMLESDRIVGEFSPVDISVEPFGAEQQGHKLHLLWDPFKKRKVGGKRKRGDWDFDFGVSSDSDGKQDRDDEQNRDEEPCDWVAALGEIMDEYEAEDEEEGEASADEDEGVQCAGDGAPVVAEPPEETMLVAATDECKDEVGPQVPAELPPPPPHRWHASESIACCRQSSHVGRFWEELPGFLRKASNILRCVHACWPCQVPADSHKEPRPREHGIWPTTWLFDGLAFRCTPV